MIFVASLIFAFIVWAILKLSYQYPYTYNYKVNATTSLPNREFTSLSNGALIVRGKSSGYYILRQMFDTYRNKNVVNLDIAPLKFSKISSSEDKYFLIVEKAKEEIDLYLKNKITIDEYLTDTLFFSFKKVESKRVPIYLDARLSYKEGFSPYNKVVITPDSVDIHGDIESLSKIDSLKTTHLYRRGIDSDIQGMLSIEGIKGLNVSYRHVYYSQQVGRYYSNRIECKVDVRGLDTNKILILTPSKVEIIYKARYDKIKQYSSSDFKVYVDYDQLINSISKKAYVKIDSLPDGVISAKVSPKYLDNYIVSQQ